MRPPAAVAAIAVAVLAVAACGDSDDDDTASTASTPSSTPASTDASTDASTSVPATTTVDSVADEGAVTSPPPTTVPVSVPAVDLPAETPTELVVTVVTEGSGPEAADGDSVFVNYVGVRSEDGVEFDNNYGGTPLAVVLGEGGVIAGWEQGLQGAQSGARLQLDIPSDLAYGDEPPGEPIQPGDALSFVIDVSAVVPEVDAATAPTADDVPLATEPSPEVVTDDLTTGDGDTLEEGMTAVVHLVAARADTGEVLESTWTGGQPQPVVVAQGQLLDALVEGLPGMNVGGRRAVTIPYGPTFGETGQPDLGLPPKTDLVVIADLFALL